MPQTGMLEVLRPCLWLSLIAFLVGFLAYAALGTVQASAAASESRFAPRVSAPATGDWNLPKQI